MLTLSIVRSRPSPTVNLSAVPELIHAGESAVLTWDTFNADTCTLDQGIGEVPASGSMAVQPTQTMTYTLSADGPGGNAKATVTITVLSSLPQARDDTAITEEDRQVVVDVLANDTGADGEALSLTALTQGMYGTTAITSDGKVNYTPTTDFHGTDHFQYTVSGAYGNTASATVTVNVLPVNDTPAAMAQTLVTNEDSSVDFVLTGSDPDGDALSFRVLELPAHGVLMGTSPNLTYTPSPGYHGSDGFTFLVNDGQTDSVPALVSINVLAVNHPPTANDLSVSTNENEPISIMLAGSDTDGDTLTFVLLVAPSHGALTGAPPQLTYTPSAEYRGPDAFAFKVSDGQAESAAATVTVMVQKINHAPVAADDSATTIEDQPIAIPVLANDQDPDGDVLHIARFAQPAHGSVAAVTGDTLVYTPQSGFHDVDTFAYTVTDNQGGEASATVSITVKSSTRLGLQITSPADGAWVAGNWVMVRGLINNGNGKEIGVNVNGVAAEINGEEFVANYVPVLEGQNVLVAMPDGPEGSNTTASVTVNADRTARYIELVADMESGLSPLETNLHVSGSFPIANPSLTYTGPGEVEFLESSTEVFKVRMSAAGIYTFTVQAMDSENIVHTDIVAIAVQDRDQLDILLQSKWTGMKDALGSGNSEAALGYFHPGTRELYAEIFKQLGSSLPGIASQMRDIELIYAKGGAAKYRIKRQEEVQGEIYDVSYYIYFAKDPYGIWRIARY
ncbi:MAG TPA: adhesin [Syntrophobacteraceae bacterium]|nr:adhesin [Syntrophobacteraceae bacterium]